MSSSRPGVRRIVSSLALTATLGAAVLPVAAALPAAATTRTVSLVGWGGGGRYDGWAPGSGAAYGSAGGQTATVNSDPATSAQSTGVVLIDTVLTYEGAEGAGTGIVLTSTGEVLTNYHVVEGATSVKVTIASTGKTYSASVVGHSTSADVALLQLKGATGLTTATIDDNTVSTGDKVTAVGNAEGTGSLTAAAGTVTDLSTSITTAAEGSVAGETLTKVIQTDADVVPGDSGGPLLDRQGEVVGIDTAASTGTEIDGYAIPIARALSVVGQIRSGNETSTVQIGASAFLGVEVDSSTSYGGAGGYFGNAGFTSADGATVAGVVDGSPAAKAGLAAGDTITAVGSTAVSDQSSLSAALVGRNPGERVTISWLDASGSSHHASVTLAASPVA